MVSGSDGAPVLGSTMSVVLIAALSGLRGSQTLCVPGAAEPGPPVKGGPGHENTLS